MVSPHLILHNPLFYITTFITILRTLSTIDLAECTRLQKLEISECRLSKENIQTLFKNRGKQTWPELNNIKASVNVTSLRVLTPTLNSFEFIDRLDLSHCWLGVMAAKLVGNLLNHTKIKKLIIGGNDLKDDGLKCIVEANNAKHLVRLTVGGGYSQAGYTALSTFLHRDDTQLKILGVDIQNRYRGEEVHTREEIQSMFIDSIGTDSNLEVITMGGYGYDVRGDTIKDKIIKLICNTDTMQSLIDSNHKFCALGYNEGHVWDRGIRRHTDDDFPFRSYAQRMPNQQSPELNHLFEINMEMSEGAGGSIVRAIRRKIRGFYFRKYDFDVTYFVDMDVNLLPYVLDLVTRIEYRDEDWLDRRTGNEPLLLPNHDNLSGIYRLVRNCPVGLFSFPSPHVLLKEKDDTLKQKDETIFKLESANKTLMQRLVEQAKEIEQLKKLGGPTPSNKRARTSECESKTTDDTESRFAALEADVALLKQKMK